MGRAKNPDFSKVKSKVGSKNENVHRRREPNKVKIFNDKNYMKAVKVTFLTTKTMSQNDNKTLSCILESPT